MWLSTGRRNFWLRLESWPMLAIQIQRLWLDFAWKEVSTWYTISIQMEVLREFCMVIASFWFRGQSSPKTLFWPQVVLFPGTKLKTFDWPSRYKVAIGTARGLLYLHEQCRRRIIHRDIKASNILLDGDFEPQVNQSSRFAIQNFFKGLHSDLVVQQISDFGLAKWLPKEWSHHSVCPVEGTFG